MSAPEGSASLSDEVVEKEIARLSGSLANPERFLNLEKEMKELLSDPGSRMRTISLSEEKKYGQSPRPEKINRIDTMQKIHYTTIIQKHWRGKKHREEHGVITYDGFDGIQVTKPPTSGPPTLDKAASSVVMRSIEPPAVTQVGGHGMLRSSATMQGVIVKQGPACEMYVYKGLQGTSLEPVLPSYHGGDDHGQLCDLRLQDLTFGMVKPCIMDIKIGKRTFLESEVKNAKLRPDLAKKMEKLDPKSVSEAELTSGVTKLHYMQYRESVSSTATLGWRIEGANVADEKSGIDFKTLREPDPLRDALTWFVQRKPALLATFIEQLRGLRVLLDASEWFARHEVVGSSLLFVWDATPDDASPAAPLCKMIDFAKTEELKDGATLSHRQVWEVGNHEDGYLLGLDNLIDRFESIKL